jgi:hypothetical protein
LKEVKRLLVAEALVEDRGDISWLRRDGAAVLSAENERKWGRSAVGSVRKRGLVSCRAEKGWGTAERGRFVGMGRLWFVLAEMTGGKLKCQGVLGSVLKTTTKDPGGQLLFFFVSPGGRLVCVGRDKFRFRVCCVFPFLKKKLPPLMQVLKTPIYR